MVSLLTKNNVKSLGISIGYSYLKIQYDALQNISDKNIIKTIEIGSLLQNTKKMNEAQMKINHKSQKLVIVVGWLLTLWKSPLLLLLIILFVSAL